MLSFSYSKVERFRCSLEGEKTCLRIIIRQGLKEYRRAIASFKLALEHSCDDSTNAQCQCRISMSQCFFELGDFEVICLWIKTERLVE